MPQTTMTTEQQLNQQRAVRLGEKKSIGDPLSYTWWDPIGGDWFRLKNFKNFDVIGSIRKTITFGGFVWEAKVNQYSYEKTFTDMHAAAAWVEEYEN